MHLNAKRLAVISDNTREGYPPVDLTARDSLVEIASIPIYKEREKKFTLYLENLFIAVKSSLNNMSKAYCGSEGKITGSKGLPELWRDHLYHDDFKHRKAIFSNCMPEVLHITLADWHPDSRLC